MMRARKHVNAKFSASQEKDTRGETDKSGRSSLVGGGSKVELYAKIILVALTLVVGFGFWFENHRLASSSIAHVPPFTSLIPSQEDANLVADADGQVYHVIFSTDCGSYQAWQSYMTFFRAMKVRQPGHVTRIASGCTEEEKTAIEAWFSQNIQHMSQRFHLLLTPHFSEVKDENGNVIGDYKFFNKPFGLKYWLENTELLDYDGAGNFPNTANAIVILIDPDMSLLRPITKDFTSDEDVVIADFRKGHILGRTVEHGKPFAQAYGFGSQFLKLDLEKIGGKGTRLTTTTNEEGLLYYTVGPPYLATVTDMYQISLKWTEFVPRVHEQYPHLLAEMFAFCLAAAHLDLKHQVIQSLMVSDTHSGKGEGWPLIDFIPEDKICAIARKADYRKYPLPHVVHLCQRYSLGQDWFFGKRRIPHDVYECPSPLFEEPPDNVGALYKYKFPPNGQRMDLTLTQAKREAFMICHLTNVLNEAAEYYKRSACDSTANLKRNKKVADLFRERKG